MNIIQPFHFWSTSRLGLKNLSCGSTSRQRSVASGLCCYTLDLDPESSQKRKEKKTISAHTYSKMKIMSTFPKFKSMICWCYFSMWSTQPFTLLVWNQTLNPTQIRSFQSVDSRYCSRSNAKVAPNYLPSRV